ncbi:MAG: MBL fold metallo-hydrolase, partial [Nitrosomonas sp.]|nr:MBL fold metallo-hydrolase [Nitrosomonas sp.]
RKNRMAFSFDPETIDFVLLTHAHIDHSGLLPRLGVLGFKGPVYTTSATVDLLNVMLKDSAHIQEKEAEWQNKKSYRKQRTLLRETAPLYTVTQAETFLKQLKAIEYNDEVNPNNFVKCIFRDAGHILGSAIIEVWVKNSHKKIVFSGDLGQPGHPIVRDPTPIKQADILFIESTYGDRLHRSMADTHSELIHAINDTLIRKGGNIILPAFTVGRTQDLLFLLVDLHRQGKLGPMNIYVDSPMALAATEITLKHMALLDKETTDIMQWLKTHSQHIKIHFIQDVEESMQLNDIKQGAVIISASGMCDAGRIKHHLKYNLGRPECTILITGFQAAGTLGRRLVDGIKRVRIYGQEVSVKADIYTIGGLSAHADQAGLINWLSHFEHAPEKTFVVHGEPSNATSLANKIRDLRHWNISIPEQHSSISF